MAEVSEFLKRKANEAAAKKEGGTQWLEDMRNRTEEQIQADIAAANENSQQPKVHKGPLSELSGDRQEQPAGDSVTQPKAGGIGGSIEDAMKSTFDSLRGKVAAPTAGQMPQVRPAGVQPAGMLYGDGGKNPLSSAQKMRGAVVDKLNNLTSQDMLRVAQKEYDDYTQSEEYQQKVRQNQAAKGAALVQGSGVSTGAFSTPQKAQEDVKEKELRAVRDYYQQQFNQEETQRIMEADLAEFEKWPEEDKQKLRLHIGAGMGSVSQIFGANPEALARAAVAQKELEEKYGKDTVDRLMRSVSRSKNAQMMQEAATEGQQAGEDYAVLGSTATVPMNLIGSISAPIGYLSEAVRGGKGQYPTLDPNNIGNLPNVYSGAVRGQVAQDIAGDQYDENGNLIKEGGVIRQGLSYAYQGGMSMLDSAARAVVGGGQTGSLTLAAMGSFGQTMSEASKQGATPTQALILATGTAALEAATEKIPLERMLKAAKGGAKGARAIAAEALKQAGIEATTEEVSLLGSLLLEGLVLQGESNYRQGIGEAIASGMSYKDAKAQADKAVMAEALQTLAVSGFAGLFSGGGSSMVGNLTGGNTTNVDGGNITPNGGTEGAQPAPAPRTEAVEQAPAPQAQAPTAQPVAAQEAVKTPEQMVLDAATETGKEFAQPPVQKSAEQQAIDDLTATVFPNAQEAEQVTGPAVDSREGKVYNNTEQTGGENNGTEERELYGTAEGILPRGTGEGRDGGVRNSELQVQRGASGRVAEGSQMVQGDVQTEPETGGSPVRLGTAGELRVSDGLRAAQQARGTPVYAVREATAEPATYESALQAARAADAVNGWCVTQKSRQELRDGNIRTFMNENGTVGVGVAPDGDIVAVFKNPQGGPRKAMDTMMPIAIEQGGKKLDCYGEGLVRVYERYGFVPVARVAFNPEYANDGWTPEKGYPYIYMMMHNGDSAETVAANIGKYPSMSKEQLTALPTYDADGYDDAMNLRDEKLKQVEAAKAAGIKGTGAAEANFSGKAAYQDLLTDENTQRDRPDDVRPMEVPKVDGYGRNVSEAVGNMYGAKITTDEMAGTIEELVQEGALGFDRRSNQQALNDAAAEIAKKTPSAVEKQITANIARGRIQDGDIEKAMLLYAHYANQKGERAQANAAELVVDLATMANMTGRNLQLFKLLRKLTPEGQVYAMKRTVEQNVQRMVSSGKVKADSDAEIDPQLLEDYRKAAEENMRAVSQEQKAESEEKMLEIQQAIFGQVAGKLKGTLKSKWDAWRYMCMLGNGKTQIRNISGNTLFVPYKTVKDTMGAAFEKLLPQNQRTKSIFADPELLKWARQDAKTREVNNALKYTGKLGDDAASSEFAENVPVFDSKAMEKIRKAVEFMPQAGDMVFKNGYYAQSLAGFLKARGYKLADIQNGNVSESEMVQARGYAIQEAMKATFNDLNSFSDLIVGLRFRNPDSAWKKAANIAMEGVLPFRRTPANIVARFAEYSPAGVVKGIVDMATNVRKGKLSAATAIDEISAGLTGTGIMALGYFLSKGIGPVKLVGKLDDEDEKRQGHQAYALEITLDGEVYSYKIDWAAPANLPLFVGANICKALEERGADSGVSGLSSVLNMTKDAFEPMLALSCMSSLNDLFESARYAQEGEVLYSIAADAATSYLTQGIPALARQGYQASQKDKMTTFANDPDPMTREGQKLLAQIPFAAENVQTEKRNAWGETERTESAAERIANAFINPGTLRRIDNGAVETEIHRLNEVQEKNVTPPDIPKKISYKDKNGTYHEGQRLTEEQYQKLAQTQGQTAKRIVENLVNSKAYQSLTDAQKAYTIQAAYDYAQEMGKRAALPDYYSTAPSWISGTKENDTNAFIARGAYRQLDSVVSQTVENLGQGWAVSDAAKQDLDSLWNSYKGVNKAVQGKIMEQAEGDTKLYLEARKGGADASEWMQAMGKLEKVQPIKGAAGVKQWQNCIAIANAGLDNAATDAMMRAYMDESAERKYNWARNKMGYSAKDYASMYAIFGRESGEGKAERVRKQWIENYGLTEQEAKDFYKLLGGTWKPWEE